MIPEKQALAVVWSRKHFLLFEALGWAAWTALALSWFWLPDSHVWGLALTAAVAVGVLFSGVLLVRRALTFYGESNTPLAIVRTAILRPRFYFDLALLLMIGIYVPYKLSGWHPPLPGLTLQTASLLLRFLAAYVLAVSAWLILASLMARLGTDSAEAPGKSSPAPPAPQTAQPNP